MQAVFLDHNTVGEVDYSPLHPVLEKCSFYNVSNNDEVLHVSETADVIITNKIKLTRDILAKLPKLKLICLTATGTDNVDLQAAGEYGIAVCNVAAYSTDSVAQLTFTLLLALVQSFPAYHKVVQAGEWQRRTTFNILDFPIHELTGKTLGIVGFGDIGKKVATIAKAFGMQVLLANLPGRPARDDRLSLTALLPKVDFLTLHCPLTTLTKGLIGITELNLMKPTAFLINTSRGAVIDEPALATALKQGKIAGAALDVLSQEPPSDDHCLIKLQHPNLIITPHIAWASIEARQR